MVKSSQQFERSVFINCPFDSDYLPLLRPLLFTVVSFGFTPRLASERSDSGEHRIEKIAALIKSCQYSIHDLSRLRASEIGEYARMNMPFELGIEYGCRHFGAQPLRAKKCLVLEKDQHEFQKAISDLSGIDIKRHDNEPIDLVRAVRDWFVETVGLRGIPSTTIIWYRFTDFTSAFHSAREAEGFTAKDLSMMPIPEYIDFIRSWMDGTANHGPTPRKDRTDINIHAAGVTITKTTTHTIKRGKTHFAPKRDGGETTDRRQSFNTTPGSKERTGSVTITSKKVSITPGATLTIGGSFVVEKTAANHFRFNLRTRSNEVILTGEQYESRTGVENGIESVRRNALDDRRYERLTTRNGNPYFVLKASNDAILGVSEMYSSVSAMENGIASVKAHASRGKVIDRT